MSNAAKKAATYQDALDAPPHKVAEVSHGTLSLMSRPASLHARPFDEGDGGPGGWAIEIELAALWQR
jgi:hypothetical protein